MNTSRFILILLAAAIALAAATFVSADAHLPSDIRCTHCKMFLHNVAVLRRNPATACRLSSATSTQDSRLLLDACDFLFGKNPRVVRAALELRRKFAASREKMSISAISAAAAPAIERDIEQQCIAVDMCQASIFAGAVPKTSADAAGLNVRVMPRNALRPGGSSVGVRFAAVTNTQAAPSWLNVSYFDYSAPFWAYWSDLYTVSVKSQVMLTPGIKDVIPLGAAGAIPVKTPRAGEGVRILSIGDPCFSSKFVTCKYGEQWQILERLTGMLNLLATQHGAFDSWILLGDNFYELDKTEGGIMSAEFFKRLSLQALGKPVIPLIGNHDIWQNGGPEFLPLGFDTMGNSFIQLYPLDSIAAATAPDNKPFAFPKNSSSLLPQQNVVAFYTVGDIAFITTAAIYDLSDAQPYFARACSWLGQQKGKVSVAVLLNHWSGNNCGAKDNMTAAEQRDYIVTLPGCDSFGDRLIWFEGHSHENVVVRPGIGFRTGGAGMSSSHGNVNFGFTLLDTATQPGTLLINYFDIADASDPNGTGDVRWNALKSCVTLKNGLQGCTQQHSTLWAKIPGMPLQ